MRILYRKQLILQGCDETHLHVTGFLYDRFLGSGHLLGDCFPCGCKLIGSSIHLRRRGVALFVICFLSRL
ncbi:hypothetical protein Mapa_017200 [Marchantia paleacea]|nr:hypothetical protein Mapa_017200 [Marchantia paleacea]